MFGSIAIFKRKDPAANHCSCRCSAGHGISKYQLFNCLKLLNQFILLGVYGSDMFSIYSQGVCRMSIFLFSCK